MFHPKFEFIQPLPVGLVALRREAQKPPGFFDRRGEADSFSHIEHRQDLPHNLMRPPNIVGNLKNGSHFGDDDHLARALGG